MMNGTLSPPLAAAVARLTLMASSAIHKGFMPHGWALVGMDAAVILFFAWLGDKICEDDPQFTRFWPRVLGATVGIILLCGLGLYNSYLTQPN